MTFPERWRDLPVGEYAFPGPQRDRLVAAVASGRKTATTSLLLDFEVTGDPLPRSGDREVVVDSGGRPLLVTRATAVVVQRLAEVPLEHALAEGEGFASVAQWRAAHERFWRSDAFARSLGLPEVEVDDDTAVVRVAFTVVDRLGGGGVP